MGEWDQFKKKVHDTCEWCGARVSILEQHLDYRGNQRWLCESCSKLHNYDTQRCAECGDLVHYENQVHTRDGKVYCNLCRPMPQSTEQLMDVPRGRFGSVVNDRSHGN